MSVGLDDLDILRGVVCGAISNAITQDAQMDPFGYSITHHEAS